MPRNIVELYTEEDVAKLERKVRRHRAALTALAVCALIACVTLAALTNLRNISWTEPTVIAISIVVGWICIYDGVFIVSGGKKEIGHANMLRSGERERVDGPLTVTDERFRIRGSIAVRRVVIDTETGPQKALVCDTRTPLLKGRAVTAVYTAHGYVAAVEVEG